MSRAGFPGPRPLSRSRTGIALLGLAGIAAFFLIAGRQAQVLGALPYLLVLACPLMHLFMHHGQSHGPARPDAGEHRHERH